MSLTFFDQKPEAIYEITINNRFDVEVKFASVDIFVPVAAHLTKGGLPELIGRKIKQYKCTTFAKPYFNEPEKMLIGEVMYIDNFGNCVTNISKLIFDKTMVNFNNFEINIRNILLKNITVNTQTSSPIGKKKMNIMAKLLLFLMVKIY